MIDISTGIKALDDLPKTIGAVNGNIPPALTTQALLYAVFASLTDGVGVILTEAGTTFAQSAPVAVSHEFLDDTGYADLEGWAEAVAESEAEETIHPDDVHTLETHIATRCAGDFKVRIKGAGGPSYVRLHVQLLHADGYRIWFTQAEET